MAFLLTLCVDVSAIRVTRPLPQIIRRGLENIIWYLPGIRPLTRCNPLNGLTWSNCLLPGKRTQLLRMETLFLQKLCHRTVRGGTSATEISTQSLYPFLPFAPNFLKIRLLIFIPTMQQQSTWT